MRTFSITYRDLHTFVGRMFRAHGLTPEQSNEAADVLCYADLHGFDTHGICNLERVYLSQIQKGQISPTAKAEVVTSHGAVARVNGHNGLGLVVATQATDLAIARAREFGVGIVTVFQSSHFGSAGYYTYRMQKAGMIGLVMTNLGKQALVRPPLGSVALLGTNPLSAAAPANLLPPFLLDMSTSVVATGKIRAAQKKGEMVPAGWLIDDNDQPVTDPWAFDQGTGYLQLLGGKPETGVYKGYGLALLIDILCGVLSGAAVGPNTDRLRKSAAEENDDQNIGHFFLALHIEAFRNLCEFKLQMQEMLQCLLDCPGQVADKSVLYPGYPEEKLHNERLTAGIPLDETTYLSLCDLAQRFGQNPPVATSETYSFVAEE